MATSIDPPRPGSSAAAIVERWLPETGFAGRGAGFVAPPVRLQLAGPGGGAWDLTLERGGLRVSACGRDIAPAPGTIWLRQSTRDFLAVFFPDPDLPALLPRGWTIADLLLAGDPRELETLQRLDGRLAFEILGRRRRRFAIDVAIGAAGLRAGRPRATLSVAGPAYDDLRAGRTPPLRALLDGTIRIEGDRALAMQVLTLAAARLARA